MDKISGSFTVFFEDPFWVGVISVCDTGRLRVSKIIFGAEPSDCEIYEFVLKKYDRLKFSPSVKASEKENSAGRMNYKRRRKQACEFILKSGAGTKSQQAMKLWQEQAKALSKEKSKMKKLFDEKRRFDLKQQKKKEKHKGH